MPNYRRIWIPGGTYFFTLALADRGSTLLVDRIAELRHAFRAALAVRPCRVDAIVVLPDHVHAVWTMPARDADYARRWAHVKSVFSRSVPVASVAKASCARKSEREIWQRRYWARAIADERDLAAHIDYVHRNPVKHGHAAAPIEWPWSSFHRYVRTGLLPPDWHS